MPTFQVPRHLRGRIAAVAWREDVEVVRRRCCRSPAEVLDGTDPAQIQRYAHLLNMKPLYPPGNATVFQKLLLIF
jgi:hypothetical protein